MKQFFARAEKAPTPQLSWAIPVTIGYAVVLTVMSLAQLFTLEDVIPMVEEYWFPGGAGAATLFVGVVVTAQVFSLPYLLRMQVSPLFRLFGAVLSFVAPLMWLGAAVYALASDRVLANGGMFGEKLVVPADASQVAIATVLVILAVASAYGLVVQSARKK